LISLAFIGFYFYLFLIPYWILKYRVRKKYERENPKEYYEIYKSKSKDYKLPKNRKVEIIIYSIWFALTFLVFKSSIYNFIRHIKFDQLFGISEGWVTLSYIGITGLICYYLYQKKFGNF
jgi:Ca2+/Na+ antiporter